MSRHEALDGDGSRYRVTIGEGKRVYIIATRDASGRAKVLWTMPSENRRADYRGRRISPAEAQDLKKNILTILEQI